MKIRVPANITLSPDAFSVSGNGRFGGVVLRMIGRPFGNPEVFYGIKYNLCNAGPGCAPVDPKKFFSFRDTLNENDPFGEGTLPAGNYQLYFFADGAPVTVRFTARGLGGSVELQPVRPLPITVEAPRPTALASNPATLYYAAGATHDFGGLAGGELDALRFDSTIPAPGDIETLYGACAFAGKPYPGGGYIGPGCSRLDRGDRTEESTEYSNTGYVGNYRGDLFGAGYWPPTRWTIGDYYLNAGPTKNAYYFLVFFNFDETYTP